MRVDFAISASTKLYIPSNPPLDSKKSKNIKYVSAWNLRRACRGGPPDPHEADQTPFLKPGELYNHQPSRKDQIH